MSGGNLRARVLGVALSTYVLASCTPTYRYDNVSYPSSEVALAAARTDVERRVGAVSESPQKIGGSVLIVLPTRDIIRAQGVVRTGNPREEQVSYIVEVLELGFKGRAEVVRRGRMFDTAIEVISPNVETEDTRTYDYKLWLHSAASGSWQWYLSKNGNPGKIPVSADLGLTGTLQSESFNRAVVDAAARLGGHAFSRSNVGSSSERRTQSSGTGFFLDPGGLSLTNAHVVDSCSSIHATTQSGVTYPASVIAADRANDLALLKVAIEKTTYAQFRSGSTRQGEQIVVYGYPLGGALGTKGNISAGLVSANVGLLDDSRKFQISAPVQPGNSGGPVLDQQGNVIGIVTSKLNALSVAKITGDIPQNVNFAIKASTALTFLEAHDIRPLSSRLQKNLTIEDIGERARAFTFLIDCK
jgi:S1-C subfamily serine protease